MGRYGTRRKKQGRKEGGKGKRKEKEKGTKTGEGERGGGANGAIDFHPSVPFACPQTHSTLFVTIS